MAKTDTDLQELKNLINTRLDKIENKVDTLRDEVASLKIGQAKIEARLEEWKPSINKISDLAEKVGELKNWRQIALIVITGTFGSLFGWFLRGGRF
jgi:archaellum component FlaC